LTEYTRPATWEDVRTLASHLNEAGVAYALVGGYALGAHGYNRFTEDVDILVRINDEFTVDVMPSIAGLSWTEMQPHIIVLDIEGIPLRVLDLPGLLKTKQGVRPKDQMDAAVIAEALRRIGTGVKDI